MAGLRWGELVALTTRRVDLKRRRIEVVDAITGVHGPSDRWVDQDPPATLGANPALPCRRTGGPTGRKAPGDLVFTAPGGGVLRNTNFRPRFFDPAADKAGLAGLTPHQLRHTAASLAVAASANVKAVQQMLGHASAAMTLDVYAGLFADDLDGVADRLDRAFTKLNADQMRTARLPSQSNQGPLPFETSPGQATG